MNVLTKAGNMQVVRDVRQYRVNPAAQARTLKKVLGLLLLIPMALTAVTSAEFYRHLRVEEHVGRAAGSSVGVLLSCLLLALIVISTVAMVVCNLLIRTIRDCDECRKEQRDATTRLQ